MVLVSCEQDQNDANLETIQEIQVDMSDFTLLVSDDDIAGKSANATDKCHSMKNLEYRLKKDPGLQKKMYDIEYQTRKAIAMKSTNAKGKPGSGGGGGTPPQFIQDQYLFL